MKDAIQITMDSAGRLVVPKSIRERAGLVAGQPLNIRLLGERIELSPAYAEVDLVREGQLLVARPSEPSELLTDDEVRRTLLEIRAERPRD